ncbi:hypothetical protein AB0K00_54330 [Dactylosporangium sp. NPDC049525]|uniref:hypothetical protein n=1 Tax=Dactylosporangium sp. NPDC049525 TaxID=3154730 RepID=UPI00342B65BD
MPERPKHLRSRLLWTAGVLLVALTACSPDAGPAAAAPTSVPVGATPESATLMVCEKEVEEEVAEALGLPTSQPLTSTWVDGLFTCAYRYGDAVMPVSVKQLPDVRSAEAYFAQQQAAATNPVPFQELGDAGFATNNGSTFIRKDRFVLRVDVSKLPDVLGPKDTPRNHVGIAVASVIIGCWVEGRKVTAPAASAAPVTSSAS